jgi:hypothetical protein
MPLKHTALATDKQGAVFQLNTDKTWSAATPSAGIDRQGTAAPARTMSRLGSCNASHTTRPTWDARQGNAIREAGLNVRAMM